MEIPDTYVAQAAVSDYKRRVLAFIVEALTKRGVAYEVDEQAGSVVVDSTSAMISDAEINQIFHEANRRALS